jgi:hypothetical protein
MIILIKMNGIPFAYQAFLIKGVDYEYGKVDKKITGSIE